MIHDWPRCENNCFYPLPDAFYLRKKTYIRRMQWMSRDRKSQSGESIEQIESDTLSSSLIPKSSNGIWRETLFLKHASRWSNYDPEIVQIWKLSTCHMRKNYSKGFDISAKRAQSAKIGIWSTIRVNYATILDKLCNKLAS